MNRDFYFKYIEERLSFLSLRIRVRGKLNLLDFNLHAENFFRDLLNLVYGYDLINLNEITQNVEAIDLFDPKNKILIQVSATATKSKIQSSLDKIQLSIYANYKFQFLSLVISAELLRGKKYQIPESITFEAKNDIHDHPSILRKICTLPIDEMKLVYELIKAELGTETPVEKVESNLTSVINMLSEVDLDPSEGNNTSNAFDIENKIIFNGLDAGGDIIRDYKIYCHKIDQIYTEFDKLGVNKSRSVLQTIRNEYIRNRTTKSSDELFFLIIDNLTQKIKNTSNFTQIPIEELEQCISILVVDAFIRCKIFKKPTN